MNRKTKVVFVLNCIVPLTIGAIVYYLFSPEVIFVKQVDEIIGCRMHLNLLFHDNIVLQAIRFYVLDMLWAYALVFAIEFIIGNNTANLKTVFGVAFLFSTTMEILQLTTLAKGTFDVWDIICEFVAEVIAVFIIKYTLEEAVK